MVHVVLCERDRDREREREIASDEKNVCITFCWECCATRFGTLCIPLLEAWHSE